MDEGNKRKFTSFDEYLSTFPENVKERLEKIRSVIKEVVPEAEETISYNMPTFRFHGILVYFAGYKGHIGLYPGDSKTIIIFKDQLKGYETSKGTIRLPLDKALPLSLIKTIVQFRVQTNLEKFDLKLKKKNKALAITSGPTAMRGQLIGKLIKSLIMKLLLSYLLLFSYSCKKEVENNPSNNSSSIIAGDPSGMNIKTYDTLIIRDLYIKTFEIDVDNDQINDYRFVSYNLTGPFMGISAQNGTSLVSIQNSAQILSFSETDTLFSNLIKDTLNYGSEIDIYLKYEESCLRIKANDSIKKIWDQNKVLIRKNGEKISKGERFVFDSVNITRTSYSSVPQPFYYNQDTTIYQQFVYLDQCNTIQNNETLFFGIKIGEKLGWIKFMIMDDYKLFLMESALQK